MSDQMINKLIGDINKLNKAIEIINNNEKIHAIRLEMLGTIFSALIAAGQINKEIAEQAISIYSTSDSQFSDDFIQQQKEAMIDLLSAIKVR
ncbi:TPA: hypothetical protein ON737_003237 [Morganella morganii]|nr:hypothetical protein [Morganella morganii]HCR3762218.1 hypothetical protein [Morganella morganii]HCT5327052.1 hypothetical protein [Morganella morganii]